MLTTIVAVVPEETVADAMMARERDVEIVSVPLARMSAVTPAIVTDDSAIDVLLSTTPMETTTRRVSLPDGAAPMLLDVKVNVEPPAVSDALSVSVAEKAIP